MNERIQETFHCRLFRVAADKAQDHFLTVVRIGQEDQSFTFGQVMERANQFAQAYSQQGVKCGDVALIFLRQGFEGIAAFLGAILAGAIPSFMPSQTDRQDPELFWVAHAKLCQHIEPAVLVTDADSRERVTTIVHDAAIAVLTPAEVPNDEQPLREPPLRQLDDLLLLQHSSGTTGLKKGVMLSHRAVMQQLDLYAKSLKIDERDCVVSWLPLYHDMGLVACFLLPLTQGVPVVLLDPFEWVMAPTTLLDSIAAHSGTLVWLPNFAFNHLARYSEDVKVDLGAVRAYINCSEPCRWSSFQTFAQAYQHCGVEASQLQVCYAMAEMVYAASQTAVGVPMTPLWVDAAALTEHRVVLCEEGSAKGLALLSSGPPLTGVGVRVVDEGGADVGPGQVGEIVLSADFMFNGYFRLENSRLSADGWYKTRDTGFLYEGELYVLGRLDDMIIVCGKNVYAHSIETEVSTIEGVSPGRVVAFGVYDERMATQQLVIIAESKLGDSKQLQSLHDMIGDKVMALYDLAPYAVKIVEPGWVLKTTSGKVSREGNQKKYLDTSN